MAYWITKFGDTDLSQISLRQNDPLDAALGLVTLPAGGVHDPWGSAQAPVRLPYRITADSEYVETTAGAFRTALYAVRALVGTRATLYRSPDGEAANSESVTARLESVRMNRSADNLLVMGVTLTFEALAQVWNGAAHSETITLDASPKSAEIDNDGNGIVRDISITVTATGAPITALIIENLETGHVSKIKYAGSIAVGQSLVIGCAATTIRNNGVNAYTTAFTLESGHSIREWLRLMPGANTIRVTRTGGDNSSTCVLTYSDGWM
jgi:hypothetical protein